MNFGLADGYDGFIFVNLCDGCGAVGEIEDVAAWQRTPDGRLLCSACLLTEGLFNPPPPMEPETKPG